MKKTILFLFCLSTLFLFSQNEKKIIYQFEIEENIAKPALRKTEKALLKAQELNADILFLRINTFGGELESAEKIRTLLLEAPMPVYVFIDPNAASAGALISLACDSIYMSSAASIGAASVVDQSGAVLPDKYQSYMRSLMRATAEKNGRNPLIAEAMVDPDTFVVHVSDSGKVLTFTTKEAIVHHFCEGEASSVENAIELSGISDYTIEKQELTIIDKLIGFLVNPFVSGILIMLIVGGLYFELQSPGIGFPLIAAVCAAMLYFAPHYLEGLAAHWEILMFLLGLGLLIVEIFVTPGFGIFGISGIVIIVAALVLTMIFNVGFDFQFAPDHAVLNNTLIVISSLSIGFILSLWLGKKVILQQTHFGSLSLQTTLAKEEGYLSQDQSLMTLIGKTGTAATMLRPSGKVEIEHDVYDAVANEGAIEKNEEIIVVDFENAQLVMERK
ncbi:MAG: nodulation protein NfeD [Bacteroidales bacterium]|jgi:membrane-bound serine protease (ClpP class)|nr:nodulation protein NfeD [Bacteroidales bacterium]